MSPITKRQGDKFTLPGKYLLLILSIVAVLLMIITFNTNLFSGILNSVAGVVVVPFQKGITVVSTTLYDKAKILEDIEDLRSENEELTNEIAELKEENSLLTQDKYELETLRKLYELDSEYDSYEKIGAKVIAKDAGNWYHSFVINKGTDDGLLVDMNVIADGGLVGRITSIGPNWAKVTTIISDNISTSCMVLATSDNLIVTGDLELYADGVISFSKLQDESDSVTVGDKVVTSNISDKYLPGILVGYITTIESDSNNLTKSGTLTPAVDFSHLDEVLVITTLKQTVDESTATSTSTESDSATSDASTDDSDTASTEQSND